MRIGTNPEKGKESLLVHKRHRIIIPFWIPNVSDPYFVNQPTVLYHCLRSLIASIDPSQTNITLINNHSCVEASSVAEDFVANGLIDKYVVRGENRGKLENVLAEARASFEEYITICDADFLFFEGWEDAVIRVFKTFENAGVVTCYPCPNLAFNYNTAWVMGNRWHLGNVIPREELALVERGLGNTSGIGIYSGLGPRHRFRWHEKHYYLNRNSVIALPGAVHALATMKRDIIDHLPKRKIEVVFRNGYEQQHLDYFSERMGYVRLSTPKCWAYHMGNTIPEDLIVNNQSYIKTTEIFPDYNCRNRWLNFLGFNGSSLLVRAMRRLRFL